MGSLLCSGQRCNRARGGAQEPAAGADAAHSEPSSGTRTVSPLPPTLRRRSPHSPPLLPWRRRLQEEEYLLLEARKIEANAQRLLRAREEAIQLLAKVDSVLYTRTPALQPGASAYANSAIGNVVGGDGSLAAAAAGALKVGRAAAEAVRVAGRRELTPVGGGLLWRVATRQQKKRGRADEGAPEPAGRGAQRGGAVATPTRAGAATTPTTGRTGSPSTPTGTARAARCKQANAYGDLYVALGSCGCTGGGGDVTVGDSPQTLLKKRDKVAAGPYLRSIRVRPPSLLGADAAAAATQPAWLRGGLVSNRAQALQPISGSSRMSKRLDQFMEELGVRTCPPPAAHPGGSIPCTKGSLRSICTIASPKARPVVPTAAAVKAFDELRQNALMLLELKVRHACALGAGSGCGPDPRCVLDMGRALSTESGRRARVRGPAAAQPQGASAHRQGTGARGAAARPVGRRAGACGCENRRAICAEGCG